MKRFVLALLFLTVGCANNGATPPTPVFSASPQAAQSPGTPPPVLSADLQPDVQLDRAVYAPGESIKVTAIAVNLSDTAWVWIVPADRKPEIVAKPEKSLENFASFESGKMELQAAAPVAAGTYAVCLYASAATGPELCRRPFEVKLATATPTPLKNLKDQPDPFNGTPRP